MSSTPLWKTRITQKMALLGALLMLVVAIAFPLRVFISVSLDSLSAIYVAVLTKLTNNERKVVSVPMLATNELLAQAAELKAKDMAEKNYFAHNSPDGKTPWYWFEFVGYSYRYAGENLAVNFSESEEVNRAWMESLLHRANILNKNFTEIGIGMATGTYQGREAVYVVQLFGTPSVRGQ